MAVRTALRRSAARSSRAALEALVDEQNAVKGSEGVAGYEPANGEAFRIHTEGGQSLYSMLVPVKVTVEVIIRVEPGS